MTPQLEWKLEVDDRVIEGIIRGTKQAGLRGGLFIAGRALTKYDMEDCPEVDRAARELWDIGNRIGVARWLHAFPRMSDEQVAFYRLHLSYVREPISDLEIMRDCYYFRMATLAARRYYRRVSEGNDDDD